MAHRPAGYYWLLYDSGIEPEVVEYSDGWIYCTGEELRSCLEGEEPAGAEHPYEIVRGRLVGPLAPPRAEAPVGHADVDAPRTLH